jgi:ferredoxin
MQEDQTMTTREPAGRYFITEECDGCGLCVARAPDNVLPSWDGSHCVVTHQPASGREERELDDAAMGCPRACLRRAASRRRPRAVGSDRAMRPAEDARRLP